jgi:hypothetical protein
MIKLDRDAWRQMGESLLGDPEIFDAALALIEELVEQGDEDE